MYRGRPLNLSKYVVCKVQGRNNILMKCMKYIVVFILYLSVKTLKTRGVIVAQVVTRRNALLFNFEIILAILLSALRGSMLDTHNQDSSKLGYISVM